MGSCQKYHVPSRPIRTGLIGTERGQERVYVTVRTVDGSDLIINVAYCSDAMAGRSDVVDGPTTNVI